MSILRASARPYDPSPRLSVCLSVCLSLSIESICLRLLRLGRAARDWLHLNTITVLGLRRGAGGTKPHTEGSEGGRGTVAHA